MQRGYKILIVSGILFALSIGIIIAWGMSFSGLFIKNNQSIFTNQLSLEPSTSYNSSIFINSTSRLLTIIVDSTNNDQSKFKEIVIGPNGNTISNNTFQKSFFSTISPKATGEYKFILTNLDKKNKVNMHLFFGNLPFLKESGEIDINTFKGLILGVILFLGGVISLIIGIIFLIKDRNKEKYKDFIPR